MKLFHRLILLAAAAYLPLANADTIPSGFEEPGLMDRVMGGEIVLSETTNTSTEFVDVFRAFFNKTSAKAYADLVTDHAKYVDLFPEMKEAKTTSVNSDRTVFTYWARMVVTVGIFQQTLYPEGRHTVKLARDAAGESTVLNEITNYTEYLKLATESARLIPYQNGMLVEDTVHVKLQKASATTNFVKRHLQKMFANYVSTFRDALHASY